MMIETPAEAEVGLRERKRRATSRSIQFAVLELAAERGLDQVTVDEISRAANVSPRTFFNYFPSKESAMMGENALVEAPALIEEFVAAGPQGDVFDGLLELIQKMALLGTGDRELHQLRRSVLKEYPQLFAVKVAGMRSFEEVLAEAVERRSGADAADGDVSSRSRLIAMLAITTMRHAWVRWAENDDSGSLADNLQASFHMLRTTL